MMKRRRKERKSVGEGTRRKSERRGSEEKKREYEAKSIEWCINRKANRGKQLTQEDVECNHRQSQICNYYQYLSMQGPLL